MSNKSKISYFLITFLFFIFFDIYFSNLIVNNIKKFPENPIMDLVFVQNTGAAFSILENSRIFLTIFAGLALIILIYYVYKHLAKSSTVSVFWWSMLLSGIFCNMYERMTMGYVRDFFKLNFVNFPVFNISDIFINIGVIAIVIIIVKNSYFKNNNENNSRRF